MFLAIAQWKEMMYVRVLCEMWTRIKCWLLLFYTNAIVWVCLVCLIDPGIEREITPSTCPPGVPHTLVRKKDT